MRTNLCRALLLCLVSASTVRAEPIALSSQSGGEPLPRIKEIEAAVEQFRKQDYEQTYKLLQEAGKRNADLPPARLLLAKLFLQHDQPAQGRAALEQSVVEDPGHPENHVLLGALAFGDGRLTDAWLQFERAGQLAQAERWPPHLRRHFRISAHAGMAGVAERRKDWPAAEAALTEWLTLEPRTGKARQRLGTALFRQGKRESALKALEEAFKDDPSLEPGAAFLGRLYAEDGDARQAEEWIERAVKSQPKNLKARLSLAAWLLDQERAEPARAHADTALLLAPTSVEARQLRGLIARHLKDHAEAERIFQALHLESPASFTFSNQLALALADQDGEARRRRAAQLAQVNVRLHPDSAEVLATLGWTRYRQGDLDGAEKALRAAVATGQATSDCAWYLAHVVSDRGQRDEARHLLDLALKAPGRFTFRKEAEGWSQQLARKPGPAR